MPHDMNGNLVEPGMTVLVHCVVQSVTTNDEACNCTVETEEPMRGTENYKPVFTINTEQCEVAR
jgi:hypothetical protein